MQPLLYGAGDVLLVGRLVVGGACNGFVYNIDDLASIVARFALQMQPMNACGRVTVAAVVGREVKQQ